MTQEADPKLAKLRLAYESAVQHEHAEAIAALDRGGRPVAPARCRELTESAWRELSAYIAGRERERWEQALAMSFVALDDVEYGLTGIESEMNEHQFSDAAQLLSVTQQDLGEALNELSPVRALLQPEQGRQ